MKIGMISYIELSLNNTLNPTIRIEFNKEASSIETVLNDLIKPALLASGFRQKTVDKIVLFEDE